MFSIWNDYIYIGSTKLSIHERMKAHKTKYRKKNKLCELFNDGIENVLCVVLKEFKMSCENSRLFINNLENKWIKFYKTKYGSKCLNKRKAVVSYDELREYRRRRYRENREKIKKYRREYYKKNREIILQRVKSYQKDGKNTQKVITDGLYQTPRNSKYIECPCGSRFKERNKKYHIETIKHQKHLSKGATKE